jgi:hypothetical protein
MQLNGQRTLKLKKHAVGKVTPNSIHQLETNYHSQLSCSVTPAAGIEVSSVLFFFSDYLPPAT